MKSFKLSVLLLALLALLSGQLAPNHLKDLMITEGIGIDISEEGYTVSAQLLNSNFLTDELPKENSTFTLSENAESINSSLDKIQKSISKKLYFGQTKLIVLSTQFAKEGIGENLPFIIQCLDAGADITVCLYDGNCSELLRSSENGARVPCESILALIRNSEQSGQCVYTRAFEMMQSGNGDYALPVLEYNKETDSASIKGIGIFSDGRLVNILSDESAQGYLLLSKRLDELELEVQSGGLGGVDVSVQNIKVKNHAYSDGNGLVFHSDLLCDLTVNSVEKKPVSTLDRDDNEAIKNAVKERLKSICAYGFYGCTGSKSDSLRILDTLCLSSVSDYKKCSESREHYLGSCTLSVRVITP